MAGGVSKSRDRDWDTSRTENAVATPCLDAMVRLKSLATVRKSGEGQWARVVLLRSAMLLSS